MNSSFDPRPHIATGVLPLGSPASGVPEPTDWSAVEAATLDGDASLAVGVIGLGVMGRGIAVSLLLAGHRVIGHDVDTERLAAGREAITDGKYGVRRSTLRAGLDAVSAETALGRIEFTSDLEDLHDLDVIIESVPEDLSTKMRLFGELDRVAERRTVFASNSSGLSITALGHATGRPDKVIGWHWSSPAPVMPLAEIARSPLTSVATATLICGLARTCGKNPVVVRDHPEQWGFVVNRVYFAAIREALRVVEEGVATKERVDQLMMDGFNWPVGPLTMLDGALRGWE